MKIYSNGTKIYSNEFIAIITTLSKIMQSRKYFLAGGEGETITDIIKQIQKIDATTTKVTYKYYKTYTFSKKRSQVSRSYLIKEI